jgi:RNA polymerase sigma factor (TIGR02999 family)
MAGPATESGTLPKTRDVTQFLQAWRHGKDAALDQMIPLVYKELRRIAHRRMAGERKDHTLQTTALVNEAYLKLIDFQNVNWQDRVHFFAISAQVMRHILVDFARSRRYQKRGGGAHKVTLDENWMGPVTPDQDLVALDDALKTLAEVDPRKSKVVELRYFGGLSVEETAEALHVSRRTVLNDWRLAKLWLHREMARGGRDDA